MFQHDRKSMWDQSVAGGGFTLCWFSISTRGVQGVIVPDGGSLETRANMNGVCNAWITFCSSGHCSRFDNTRPPFAEFWFSLMHLGRAANPRRPRGSALSLLRVEHRISLQRIQCGNRWMMPPGSQSRRPGAAEVDLREYGFPASSAKRSSLENRAPLAFCHPPLSSVSVQPGGAWHWYTVTRKTCIIQKRAQKKKVVLHNETKSLQL